jgi:hypothetical protein
MGRLPTRNSEGPEITIGKHSEIPDFHFDEFEGPDAPGGDMAIKVNYMKSSKTFHFCPNGWLGAEWEDSFVFGSSWNITKKGTVSKQLLDICFRPTQVWKLKLQIQRISESKLLSSLNSMIVSRNWRT